MNMESKALFGKWEHYSISIQCNVQLQQKWNIFFISLWKNVDIFWLGDVCEERE